MHHGEWPGECRASELLRLLHQQTKVGTEIIVDIGRNTATLVGDHLPFAQFCDHVTVLASRPQGIKKTMG